MLFAIPAFTDLDIIILVSLFKTFAEIITAVKGNNNFKIGKTFLYFGAKAAGTLHAGSIPALYPW